MKMIDKHADLYDFDGDDYQQDRDQVRLSSSLDKIRDFMEGKPPLTVEQVMQGAELKSITSTSANIRNLRKEQHGRRVVERTYISDGLYKYQLLSAETHKANGPDDKKPSEVEG